MSNVTNELKWLLAGIQADKQNTEKYLKFLNEQEQLLAQRLVTGTSGIPANVPATRKPAGRPKGATNGATNAATGGTGRRTRKMSAEQRKKMSEAQKRRHELKRQQTQGATTVTTGSEIPQGPIGEIPTVQ
jgi:hypothetical protein